MRMKYLLCVLVMLAAAARCSSEIIDSTDIERFCYPEAHKNTRKSCECSNEGAQPWGMRALHVDCSFKDLKAAELSQVLPLYVSTLDLSWNAMDAVPLFASDSLRLLNLMHNNITKLVRRNFVQISNMRELYLNWNSIQSIEPNAFDDLAHLQVLDLSHNNLHALSLQIFQPMLVLETLSLSWNRYLNQTGIEQLDFYRTLGVNMKLRTLKLQACSLANLILPENAPLKELDMRRNSLTKTPTSLPSSLEKLDLSENLFVTLSPNDTANLTTISELYLEDMPQLREVEEDAFVPMQNLNKISFQNSRRLNAFDAHAFGVNATKHPSLKTMIFRGTTLRTFNATLAPVFRQLNVLDLNGVPLLCDCELIWVKQLQLETNGRCLNPSRLRGMQLSNARVSDFSCDTWPHWVYGIIIFGLILICAAGIYLIVMGLRPHRGVTLRRKKVGAGSPYARVTIEPNRQEVTY